jgi:hypothetical protein
MRNGKGPPIVLLGRARRQAPWVSTSAKRLSPDIDARMLVRVIRGGRVHGGGVRLLDG